MSDVIEILTPATPEVVEVIQQGPQGPTIDDASLLTTGTLADARLSSNVAFKTQSSDMEITDNTKGLILKSPNNTRWRLTINDDGTLSRAALVQALQETATTTGSILLIVAAASLFGWIIAREQGPQMVADWLTTVTDNPYVFLLLVNVALLLIGMLLEPVAALLIMVPILLPVAREYGIDPLHFGVIMILNLVIGLITPPVGLVLYVLSSVSKAPVQRVMWGTWPFLLPLFTTLLIVTFVPELSLWLPRWLLK
jgi:TRAP-type uncharacterized transport system fused permease subunit